VNHAFGGFVDGAVASSHHHHLRPAGDMLARDGPRGPWARGGHNGHLETVLFQDFAGAPDQRAPFPPEFTGAGIVDEDSPPVGCYGMFSGFLVRL
jgi:hypothetical protein